MLTLVGVIALAVWSPSLANDFVWDDLNVIVSSERLQAPGAWWRVMTHPAMWVTGLDPGSVATWRPLALSSFALEYRLWGANPIGFHVTSIALHAVVSMLFAAWLVRIGFSRPSACVAAIVFAVHPAHVESVAWINGRSELIALLGGLLALHGPMQARSSFLVVAVGVFVAGLGKETGVIFAPGAVITAWALGASSRRLRAVASGAAVGVALWWGLRTCAVGGGGSMDPAVLVASIARWPLLVCVVFEAMVLPLRRGIVVAGADLAVAPLWSGLVGWAILCIGLGGGVWLARRGERLMVVGLTWFLAALAPLVAIVFTGWPGLNRWLYIGQPGLIVVALVGLRAWRPECAKPARWVGVVVAAGFLLLSINAQRAWRSELSLYRATVAEAPDEARGWFMLGLALAREGDPLAAADALERGLSLGDSIGGVHSVLAVVYVDLGRCDAARSAFERYDGMIERGRLAEHIAGCVRRPSGPSPGSAKEPPH